MKSEFAAIMVCATVLLSCLVILPLTVSCTQEFGGPRRGHKKNRESFNRQICKQWNFDKAPRKAADIKCREGMETVFITIKKELAKLPPRGKTACITIPEHDHSRDIEIAHAETIVKWTDLLTTVFDQIPNNHHMASSRYQKAAVSNMEKAVDAAYAGITAVVSNSSSATQIGLEALQNEADHSFKRKTKKIFADIKKCHKYDPRTKALLHRHQANAISATVLASGNMFDGIRILLAASSSEAKAPRSMKDDSSSITVLSREAAVQCTKWVKNVFDSIDILGSFYCKKQN